MRIFAATILMFIPSTAWACTGTVLHGATNDDQGKSVRVEKGQHLENLTHILITKTGEGLVCAEEKCYPAMSRDADGNAIEIVDLQGCKISDAFTVIDGLERHEIEQDKKVAEEGEDADLERNKLVAAGVALAAISNMPAPQVVPDSILTAHVVGNMASVDGKGSINISKVATCTYELRYVRSGKLQRMDHVDFSKLSGYRYWSYQFIFYKTAVDDLKAVVSEFDNMRFSYRGLRMNINETNTRERLIHNVDFLLKHGCGDSLRAPNPNPY